MTIRIREMATQTEETGEIGTEDLEERIKGIKNYDEFKKLVDLKWPISCYRNTKIVRGDPMVKDPEADLVIIRDLEDRDFDKGFQRTVKERYPEIANMGNEGWEIYVSSVKKINVEGKCLRRENFVRIGTGGDDRAMFHALQKLVEHLKMLGRVQVVMCGRRNETVEEKDVKMVECILRGGVLTLKSIGQQRQSWKKGGGSTKLQQL